MLVETQLYQLSYRALLLILLLSGPPIIVSTALGLAVAILQTATQIQEQTLSFMIKLAAVIVTLMLTGGELGGQIYRFASHIFNNFHHWV